MNVRRSSIGLRSPISEAGTWRSTGAGLGLKASRASSDRGVERSRWPFDDELSLFLERAMCPLVSPNTVTIKRGHWWLLKRLIKRRAIAELAERRSRRLTALELRSKLATPDWLGMKKGEDHAAVDPPPSGPTLSERERVKRPLLPQSARVRKLRKS